MKKSSIALHKQMLRVTPMTMWATAAVLAAGSLMAHNLAPEAKPAGLGAMVRQIGSTPSQASGLIDHSRLIHADLPAEPNPALLHSDPTAYVTLTSPNQRL